MIKHNIGTVDAMIRIAGGLTLLSYCTAKMAREDTSAKHLFLATMGAQKVAEGVTRYCPLTEAFGLQESEHTPR